MTDSAVSLIMQISIYIIWNKLQDMKISVSGLLRFTLFEFCLFLSYISIFLISKKYQNTYIMPSHS